MATELPDWRDWFAWYPVSMPDDVCVWWEHVERRWNPNIGRLVILTSYDHGEMSGAWECRYIGEENG